MHGPSPYIKTPIPTYNQLQEMHLKLEPELPRPELHELFVNAVTSWIYARLFQYLTPYTDPAMNKQPGPVKKHDWEFYHAERQFFGESTLCFKCRHAHFSHMGEATRTWRHEEDLLSMQSTSGGQGDQLTVSTETSQH